MAKIRSMKGKTKAKKSANESKVGYKDDRLNILKKSTIYMKKYKDQGYSRKDAIKNAQLDAAYMSGANLKSIEKKVAEINKLINFANKKNISVVDTSSTWQSPMKYKPIKYSNGVLYITYDELDLYKKNKTGVNSWVTKKDKILKKDIEFDSPLNNISKMYKKALKYENLDSSNVGSSRKTEDVWEVYGYYPSGKEIVYTASSSNEAKQIVKDYKLNEPKIKFTMAPKRIKKSIAGWKKGSTKFVEAGEKMPKKNGILVKRKRTGENKGSFSKFRTISGISGTDDAKKLRQLAAQSKSPLFKKVASILIKDSKGYGSMKSLISDVLQYGLQSGMVSELIYYKDTLSWYKKYKKEITMMLRDTMSEMGVDSASDVFGRNWDKSDPFAEDTMNQNLLAWYSFEETARNIGYSLGYEL